MTKKVETRLSDLEKKTNPEGEYQVVVNWDPDPELPEDDNVKVVKWDNDIDDTNREKT